VQVEIHGGAEYKILPFIGFQMAAHKVGPTTP